MGNTQEFVIPHSHEIKQADRILKSGYRPVLIWFTGLSGSGKSTLASNLERELFTNGYSTYILDGDNIRSGLNEDLTFNDEDRKENIRRIAHVGKLFLDAGIVVLTAFISPFEKDRARARQIVGAENFIEVFVDCPLEECEKRDVKGLYAKARAGEIKSFTGIDSPFEKPKTPNVTIPTNELSVAEGVKRILEYLNSNYWNN